MSEWDALVAADPEAAARLLQQAGVKVPVLLPWQRTVAAHPARFKIIRAGRRTGKTKLGAREILREALAHPGSMNWWVANTFKNVRRGYREILRQAPRGLFAKQPPPPGTGNDLQLTLTNGSSIEFYSAGNPDAMAGEGVNYVIVDEAALQPSHVWHQIIRPTLMDAHGRALLISTPRGLNWFWEYWNRGAARMDDRYAAWHFTPADNPHIDPEEIAELEETLPSKLYRQEVLAEFLKGADALFNLEAAVFTPAIQQPEGQYCYMGIDLAKHEDFTVIRASREDGEVVWHDRFQDVSWPAQKGAIIDAIEALTADGAEGVLVGVDSAGAGDYVFDELDEAGYDVEPIKFGAPGQKFRMVKLLGADIERQRVKLLEEQRAEFEAFEYHITDKGTMTFSAPEGQHDDEVAATMIEHWVRRHSGPSRVTVSDIAEAELEAEVVTTIRPDPKTDLMWRDDAWTSF